MSKKAMIHCISELKIGGDNNTYTLAPGGDK